MFSGYVVYSKALVRRVLFSILFIILSYKIYIYINKSTLINVETSSVTLSIGNKNYTLDGLKDTGNLLLDSYYGLPVVIINTGVIPNLFELHNIDFFEISVSSISDTEKIKAFKPDYITFCDDKKKYDCVVGVAKSHTGHDCIYNPNYFI